MALADQASGDTPPAGERMIATPRMLFVHVPKTAGTSTRHWLLENLPEPILHVKEQFAGLPAGGKKILHLVGSKHMDLIAARPLIQLFAGCDIPALSIVLAGVRNPYDREVSLYRFWQRNAATAQRLYGSLWADFEEFTQRQSTLDRNLTNFYQLDGVVPPNLRLLRAEHLEEDLLGALRSIGIEPQTSVPVLNAADNAIDGVTFSSRGEAAIYARYRFYFDLGLYPRLEV
jgi:hypothetical protein